jgi:predicted SprT family Zn-dependent metalloprotease
MATNSTLSDWVNDTNTTLQFDDIETEEGLVEWSRSKAEDIVEETGLDIDLSLVSWGCTGETKRQAAVTQSITLPNAKTGVPIDWEKAQELIEELDTDPVADFSAVSSIRESHIGLSWSAFEAFDIDEWEGVIRHELVHVWQHQKFGKADHGITFKSKARKLDAPVQAPKFSDAKYHLLCSECGNRVADRYRKSKTVKQPESYRSGCCNAPLEVEHGPAYDR